MKTIKILIVAFIGIIATSCHFDINLGEINGNGNVTTETREVGDFTGVRGSAGMDVFLTQGSENKVVIEADENLMDNIEAYVENGVLKITTKKSIGRSKSQKAHVTYVALESIEASSGSDIKARELEVISCKASASSGADIAVNVKEQMEGKASSGGDIKYYGNPSDVSVKDGTSGNVRKM